MALLLNMAEMTVKDTVTQNNLNYYKLLETCSTHVKNTFSLTKWHNIVEYCIEP